MLPPPLFPSHSSSISSPTCRRRLTLVSLLLCPLASAYAANPANLICTGKHDSAPVYVMATQNGTFYRTEISVDRNGRYNGVRIPVTRKEIDDECANGMSIATLSIEQPGGEKAASSNAKATKSGVPPLASLPTSFTIRTSTTIACKYGLEPPCARSVWGNFWVPGTMSAEEQAHIVHYNLSQWQFNSSTPGTHFVNSVLTVSNSDFQSDFQGKGLILGLANGCGGSYSALLQTWQNASMPSNTSGAWYATCNAINPSGSYDIYVGANRQQDVQAIISGPGLSNANPQVSVFEQYFWSSPYWQAGLNAPTANQYPAVSYAGTGAMGVAFLVAGPSRIPVSEEWALTFDNVFQYTGM